MRKGGEELGRSSDDQFSLPFVESVTWHSDPADKSSMLRASDKCQTNVASAAASWPSQRQRALLRKTYVAFHPRSNRHGNRITLRFRASSFRIMRCQETSMPRRPVI